TDGMVELGESERRGVKSWWLQLHLDGAARMPIDFSKLLVPNFTFQNGYMVVGLQKADVRKALARMQRSEDDGNDLRANPEFAKCLEQLPKDKLTSLSFTDWKTQFAGWYDLAYNFSFLFGTALPIDPAELPQDPIFLNQHLSGSVSW